MNRCSYSVMEMKVYLIELKFFLGYSDFFSVSWVIEKWRWNFRSYFSWNLVMVKMGVVIRGYILFLE